MGNLNSSLFKAVGRSLEDTKVGRWRMQNDNEDPSSSDFSPLTLRNSRSERRKALFNELFKSGKIIKERYILQKRVGEGTFGMVLMAKDEKSAKQFAIKVIKDRSKLGTADACVESALLKKIKHLDSGNESCIISILDTFKFQGYYCMVFDLMQISLQDYIKKSTQAIPLETIQIVGYQVLQALQFLKKVHVIHADLKPDNVMIKNLKTFEIRVIDLGSHQKIYGELQTYFQTRYYRAPEAILDSTYGYGVDMWSLACILFELRTREILFEGGDQIDQLVKIVEVLGPVPKRLILEGGKKFKRFSENRNGTSLRIRDKSKMTSMSRCRMLFNRLNRGRNRETCAWDAYQGELKSFVLLLNVMFEYNRSHRISAEDAMNHCFFGAMKKNRDAGLMYLRNRSARSHLALVTLHCSTTR